MDVDERMRDLMHRAGELPDLVVPPAGLLIDRGRRRRNRHRVALAAAVSACAAVAIAVPLTVSVHHRGQADSTPTASVPVARVSATELAAGHWSALPAAPIPGRTESAVAWTGQQMIVWGGSAYSAGKSVLLDDGAAYDPAANTWQRLPSSPLRARTQMASVWTGAALFVWGGLDDLAGNGRWALDGAIYDPSSQKWQMLPAAPVSGYTSAQAVWTGSQVILITQPNASVLDVAAYDLGANQWARLPQLRLAADQPGQRTVCVAAGSQVYVWSEWSYTKQISANEFTGGAGISGYTLDFDERTWTPNRLAPPSIRNVNGAQWTGRTVVFPAQQFWRGSSSGPYKSNLTSTEIDPATGAVTVIPHGPVDDLGAQYVWTGNAWLAYNNTGTSTSGAGVTHYPGEAALWNPATNAWTQLPSAPLAGYGAASVWTGTELLIWGEFYPAKPLPAGKGVRPQTAGLRFGR